jgi:hypothetical protein
MGTTSPVSRNIWLYVVDGTNVEDLALLDSQGFDTWRANPNTKAGDLILMYRTKPFSDIAYVFVARSDARKVNNWYWKDAIDIADGYRLPRVITLEELRSTKSLKHWTFLKNQQGVMQHSEDLQAKGAWSSLRRLIEERAPLIKRHFRQVWSGTGKRKHVFLSYASQDKRHADDIYLALSRRGIDVWLDRLELRPAVDWDQTIGTALRSSRAFVVCLSKTWIRRRGYVKAELEAAFEIALRRKKRFIFPVEVSKCSLPSELRKFQAVRAHGRNRNEGLKSLGTDLRLL